MAADPRFFPAAGPFTLAELAGRAGGTSVGEGTRSFTGVASLSAAGPGDVSFIEARRHLEALKASKAGAVVCAEALAGERPEGCAAIVVAQPYLGFARVAAAFHPPPPPLPGIHPTAVVAPDAEIGEGSEIGPYAVIGARARIGAGCLIGPHVTVGAGVEMGEGCRLHSHASVSHAILGRGVVLHPGARVGQEGFGFATTPQGEHVTMPQLGLVRIGDRAEVGANTCIDRGSQSDTVIGPGTRLDNLVQVGHNVRTGMGCVIVSQVGISGSTELGDFVQAGGQAGFAGHLKIGSMARIGAQAGVIADVPARGQVVGYPAMPGRDYWKMMAWLRRAALRGGGRGD